MIGGGMGWGGTMGCRSKPVEHTRVLAVLMDQLKKYSTQKVELVRQQL